jgi:hypothetical protein
MDINILEKKIEIRKLITDNKVIKVIKQTNQQKRK